MVSKLDGLLHKEYIANLNTFKRTLNFPTSDGHHFSQVGGSAHFTPVSFYNEEKKMFRFGFHTCIPLRSVFFLITLLLFLVPPALAKDVNCRWKIEGIKGVMVKEVKGQIMIKQAEDENIIEVKGTFSSEGCNPSIIEIEKIKIEGKSRDGNKETSWSFPLIGVGMHSSYDFPQSLVKGTVSFKSKTGEGYKLSRIKKGDPAQLTLFGDAVELYLAFAIPKNTEDEFTLNFGESKSLFKIKTK
jgi:hypothetical protein